MARCEVDAMTWNRTLTLAEPKRDISRAANSPASRPPSGPMPTASPKAVLLSPIDSTSSGYRGRIAQNEAPLRKKTRETAQRARRTDSGTVGRRESSVDEA